MQSTQVENHDCPKNQNTQQNKIKQSDGQKIEISLLHRKRWRCTDAPRAPQLGGETKRHDKKVQRNKTKMRQRTLHNESTGDGIGGAIHRRLGSTSVDARVVAL